MGNYRERVRHAMLPKTLEWGTDSTTNAAKTCLSLSMLLVISVLSYTSSPETSHGHVKDIVYFILYYIYIYSFIKNAPEGAHS